MNVYFNVNWGSLAKIIQVTAMSPQDSSGVCGSATILCSDPWIRENGRSSRLEGYLYRLNFARVHEMVGTVRKILLVIFILLPLSYFVAMELVDAFLKEPRSPLIL